MKIITTVSCKLLANCFQLLGACLIFAVSCQLELIGHDLPEGNTRTLRALEVDATLTVDGILDEPFWKEAETTTDFTDRRTEEQAPLQTLVRLAYTKTHLYVAIEALDDRMDQIHATERREDRFYRGDDYVQLHIDPGHNHRTKYGFFSNPLGTKLDGNEGFSGSSWNTGWTAEWEVAAKILEDRWVFEMKIPFGTMNYNKADNQTWGFNFTRWSPRLDSLSFWNFRSTDSFRPRQFGHVTGLNLAESEFSRNWETSPYISSRADFGSKSDTNFEAGIDTSFRLTPSIIAALTLNPDFGQVEADADTIELLDTERFLPERRLFFREGAEILNMRHSLYYSRRFSDITAGAKVSGQHKDLNFTFLNIHGDTVHGRTREGNSSVLRVVQNVGQKSSIGYYANTSEFDDGYSRVASADGLFFLNEDFRFSFQGSFANDRIEDKFGVTTKDSTDFLGYGSFSYQRYPWNVSLGYNAITDEFDPALGLIFRRNIFGPTFRTFYSHNAENRWYKRLTISYRNLLYQNDVGRTVLRDYLLGSSVIFPNDFGVSLEHSNEFHDPYDNLRTGASLIFHASDLWRSMDLGYATGEFQTADYHEVNFGKPWKPIERLPIRYELATRFETLPNGDSRTAWLNRIIFDYFITDDMWIKSSIQHRDQSIHNISVIYGWEFKEDVQWYLVFNSVADRRETSNSIFTKLVYTFN
jgi:hypothetical protein